MNGVECEHSEVEQTREEWGGAECEKSLIPGLYLVIVNNYKTIIIPNDSLKLAHPIVVSQAKLQLKNQMLVALIAGGFWAVILSQAAWKRSWVGGDPTHSIIAADRSVAITSDTARAQLLTA